MKLQSYEKLVRVKDLKVGDVFTHFNRKMRYRVQKNTGSYVRLLNLTRNTMNPVFDCFNRPFQMNALVIKFESL